MYSWSFASCLEWNISIFNNKFSLQTDCTAQCPNMSCYYSDIAMAVYDEKAIDHPFRSSIWKRLRDVVISLWILSDEDANDYLDYLNNIDASGKMGFTMQTENENGFEFLDLGFKLKGCNKITVDVLSKCINRLHSPTFAYSGKICYHFGNTNN